MDLSMLAQVVQQLNPKEQEEFSNSFKKRMTELVPAQTLEHDPTFIDTLFSKIMSNTPTYHDIPFVGAAWCIQTCLDIMMGDSDSTPSKNLQVEFDHQLAMSLEESFVQEMVQQSLGKGFKYSSNGMMDYPASSPMGIPSSGLEHPSTTGMGMMSMLPHHHQMPFPQQKPQPPSKEAINRIVSDFKAILRSKNPLLHVSLDQEDITHVNILIIGPPDTPYEDGFFHFDARYPHDYPWRAPSVTLVTTDNGLVRFNPNLYANGKVCLSILGTWQGPGWSSVQTMQSTFLSIQSLMNAAPYHNEPGHDSERVEGDSQKYNECIHHETLRVAVCGMMEKPTWNAGSEFEQVCKDYFLSKYESYIKFVEGKFDLDGTDMYDPLYCMSMGKFNFRNIELRLKEIKRCLDNGIAPSPAITPSHTLIMPPPIPPSISSHIHFPPVPTATPYFEMPSVKVLRSKAETDIISKDLSTPTPTTDPKPKKRKLSNSDPNISMGSGKKPKTNEPEKAENPQPPNLTFPGPHLGKIGFEDFPASWPQFHSPPLHSLHHPLIQSAYSPHYHPVFQHQAGPPSSNNSIDIKVKPPTLEEMGLESNIETSDSDIMCVVCHQAPSHYIVLPNCLQPHIFCISCASKLAKQGPPTSFFTSMKNKKKPFPRNFAQKMKGLDQSTYVSCVMCQRLSELKHPFNSIHHFTQKNPAVLPKSESMICSEHNLPLDKFCTTFMQFVCSACVQLPHHSDHTTHFADFAQVKPVVNEKLAAQIESLKNQATEVTTYRQSIEERKSEVSASATAVKESLVEQIGQMKKILDEKLALLCGQVDSAQKVKEHSLEVALTSSTQTLETIQKSIEQVQICQNIENPETLLKEVDDKNPGLMLVQLAPSMAVSNQMFSLTPAHLNHHKSLLSTMKYRDQKKIDDTQFASMMLGIPTGGASFGLMDSLEDWAIQGQHGEMNSEDVDDFYDGDEMFDVEETYGPGAGHLLFGFPLG